MTEETTTSTSGSIWMPLAAVVAIIVIIGGMIYMINDVSTQRERAIAEQWQARAQAENARAYAQTQIAQAQVEIARAHESGSTERAQVFALTLKSFTVDHSLEMILLSIGIAFLGVLQVVQFMTRPRRRGDQ